MYFSPILTGYAIANSESTERECAEPHAYEGTNGVEMNSFARRAAFALALPRLQRARIRRHQPDSQMLWVRGVNDRLSKLAPFVSYDADPYPVAIDGHAVWVTDAYTTTTRYPYGQRIGDVQRSPQSGLSDNDNYVRNSVKAVVDAYTGEVTFYVVDEQDPILRAWRGAFPDLFTPLSEMPEELREHLRYPEDLFRIQTDVYSKYRIEPALFFQRDGNAWSVAQAPGDRAVTARGERRGTRHRRRHQHRCREHLRDRVELRPLHPVLHDVRHECTRRALRKENFVMLRPFVPFSTNDERTQLQAYMTASSDPGSYGRLTTYIVEDANGNLPDGPLRVAGNAESTEAISRRISLDNVGGGGSEVRFGDLQLIPVADGLIYVRPYYVSVPQNSGDVGSVTEYRAVIVSYNDRSVLEPTVSEALARLFPGFRGDLGEEIARPSEPDDGSDVDPAVTDPGVEIATGDPTSLLSDADQAFADAETALQDGDLGLYQEKIEEARNLIADALEILVNQP